MEATRAVEAISSPVAASDVGLLTMGPIDASETLVFLHGWAGSKEIWWGTLNALASEHRGVSLDLPGTGGTPLPPGLTTMSEMAQWVADTCARLNLHSITLVGHSMGGNLAAQVALEHPSLVRRLILVDAALEHAHLPVRAAWPLWPRFGLPTLRLMRYLSWPLAKMGHHITVDQPGHDWRGDARRTHWYLAANSDKILQIQMRALHGNPLVATRMAQLTVPLFILHGARDSIVPVSRAQALAEALPNSRLVVFPNAHHCPMDTDLAVFADALREACAT